MCSKYKTTNARIYIIVNIQVPIDIKLRIKYLKLTLKIGSSSIEPDNLFDQKNNLKMFYEFYNIDNIKHPSAVRRSHTTINFR